MTYDLEPLPVLQEHLTPDEMRAWERLQAVYRAAQAADSAAARSVLLVNPIGGSDYPDLRAFYRAFVETQHGTMVELSCAYPLKISFLPLRILLEQVAPTVLREAPDVLQQYATEITSIHPQLSRQLDLHPAHALDHIALTPSERRSHRESEQTFRIITGLCAFLLQAQQSCSSLARGPLVLWWDALHEADRPTLLTFRRLNRWINQSHAPLVLVGTLTLDSAAPGVTAARPTERRYVDWHAAHRLLLQRVRAQLLGEEVVVPGCRSAGAAAALLPSTDEVPDDHIGEAEAARLAVLAFEQGTIEEGCAYALHAMRLAFFALNLEGILFLAQHIFAALDRLSDDAFDTPRFEHVWQRLTAHDQYVAIEFSVTGIRQRRDILIATWKAVALAQTFLEHHQVALECYQEALALATEPAMRAQIYMYLGLIAGKRLRNITQGEDYLRQGLREIDGLLDPAATLERGWLCNVSALMAYQLKRYQDALATIKNAIMVMKQLHHSEATHLKINLISNFSVLLEDMGRLDHALAIWGFFRNFLGAANDIFAKHYYFREGGLRFKSDDLAGALHSYRQSYAQAEVTDDSFHMDVIARACGCLSYRLGAHDEARQWYAASARLKETIGDYERLPETLLAQALCSYRTGRHGEATALLQRADDLCRGLGLDSLDRVCDAQQFLAQGTDEAVAAWDRLAILPAGTKLNRPFYLTNLYHGGTAA